MTKKEIIIKVHLVISIIVVVPTAFIYAFFSDWFLSLVPSTVDEYSFYKGICGLYLGFAIVWIIGLFNKSQFKVALVSNMIFMLGLGLGRLVSIIMDGIPSNAYLFGFFGELVLGIYGFYVLQRRDIDLNLKNSNFAQE